jgi:predicted anti-sigma-YlaC factor YlaD
MKPALPPPPESYCRSHKLLGSGLHKLHLSCRHFSDLTLQSMDRPLTPAEKFRCRFHFIMCSVCRKFQKQMRSLSMLVRASFADQEPPKPDPGFLASVRARLESISKDTNR